MVNLQHSIFYMSLIFFITCLNESFGQFVYRQSDRVQIMNVYIVTSDTTSAQQTYNFPSPFVNIPKITYSLQKINSNINGDVGFQLTTVSITNTSVTVKIQAYSGHTLKTIRIGILASDIPNSQTFTGKFTGSDSHSLTTPGTILGYCAFVYGYKGDVAFAQMIYSFSSSSSGNSVTVSYSKSAAYMESVDYNVLAIYDQAGVDSLLYQYNFSWTSKISINLFTDDKNYSVGTQLTNADTVFFGFAYWNDGSNLQYNFEVEGQNPQQVINNSNVQLIVRNNKGHIDDGRIYVFQAMIRNCPSGRFIIKRNSDYECVSSCSTADRSTYNDISNQIQSDYNTYPMNPCSPCDSSCYTCSGPNTTDCISCESGSFYDLNTKKCYSSQQPQTYCSAVSLLSQNYQQCLPCYQSCKTCSGGNSNQCTSCMSTYPYSYNGQCLQTSDGFYCDPTTFICQTCSVSKCKTCDSTLQQCSQCLSGWYLFNNICYNSIPSQTYCDSNGVCSSCDTTKCVSCIDAADKCTACSLGQYLLNNVCFSSKQDYTYCDQSGGITYYNCVNCSANCLDCTGSAANQCTTCLSGKYFYKNSCYDSQQTGSYCDSNLICYSCHSSCKECTGNLINECTACRAGEFFYQNTCSTTQKTGTYCDANLICNDCDFSKCVTCVNSADKCTSCNLGEYLLNNVCYNQQQDYTYCDQSGGIAYYNCVNCSANCSICTGSAANQCTACLTGKYFYKNSCYDTQQSGSYCNLNQICSSCDSSCKECTGGQNNECTQCPSGVYLYQNTCLTTQKAGTYCDANLTCNDCDFSKCVTCVDAEDKCTSCMNGEFLLTNVCYQTQPQYTYCEQVPANAVYQTCVNCSVNCSACTGDQPNQCSDCKQGYFFYNNQCFSTQPHTTYCDVNNRCSSCNNLCLECTGPSDSECTACPTNEYLYLQKCYQTQPYATYCDSNNHCFDCDSSKCVTCKDSADYCLTCKAGQYLFKNICYDTNPDGAFCTINAQSYYDCVNCSLNCKSCTGINSNECTSCFNQIFFYQNSCTTTQPSTTYYDQDYVCYKCDTNCKECSGPSSNECSECYDGTYLDIKPNAKTCQPCQKGCSLCSNAFNNCSACSGLYYLKGNNSCVLDCQSNEYFDAQTRDCTQCNPLCLTCTEKTNNDCSSCIGDAKLDFNNKCVCKTENYGLKSDGSSCEKCKLTGCVSCYQSDVCDVCFENATLNLDKNGKQECLCNEGFYFHSYLKKCTKCPQSNCQACTQDGTKCTKCKDGFQDNNGTCSYCNNYKFANSNNECESECPKLCEVCSTSEACSMYLKSDPDYFPPELCHYTCKRCQGTTELNCLECSSDTREFNGKTGKCECKSNFSETNEPDCKQIQQVTDLVQNIHSKFNSVGFPIQSASMVFAASPALTYSYILQQFVGDLSYVKHNEQSINNVLKQYTKFNLNNIFSLNKDSSNTDGSNDGSSLRISRLLQEEKVSNPPESNNGKTYQNKMRRAIQIEHESEIVSEKDSIMNVHREIRFFYASVIPLGTTILLFIIAITIHLIELKYKKIIKYGFLFKWNSLILATQINSNFMIFSLINIDLKYQEMSDLICMAAFGIIYLVQLIWIFRKVRQQNNLDSSYAIIETYFDRTKFMGRYYFFIVELKKVLFCSLISIAVESLKFTIWAVLALLIIEVVFKKCKNPFKQNIDLYVTIALDIIFILILAIFGVYLNSNDATQLVTFATFILILLVLFNLITVALIIYRIITLIQRLRAEKKASSDEKDDESNYSSRTSISKSFSQELQAIQAQVRWQKNPIHRTSSTNSD